MWNNTTIQLNKYAFLYNIYKETIHNYNNINASIDAGMQKYKYNQETIQTYNHTNMQTKKHYTIAITQ